jgi:hypothetical protein
VIADGDDIFGDGVNVAARLEALAEPGGISVSGVVRDQIRDKLPYPFEDRGEQNVKNIARRSESMSSVPNPLPNCGRPVCRLWRHNAGPPSASQSGRPRLRHWSSLPAFGGCGRRQDPLRRRRWRPQHR